MAKRIKPIVGDPTNSTLPSSTADEVAVRAADSSTQHDGAEPARPGPKPVELSNLQLSQICRLLLDGHGRLHACAALQISYKVFLRHMRSNADFAYNIRICEKSRKEKTESNLYRIATLQYDSSFIVRAAVAYLDRCDKIEAMRRAKNQKRRRAVETFRRKAEKIVGNSQ